MKTNLKEKLEEIILSNAVIGVGVLDYGKSADQILSEIRKWIEEKQKSHDIESYEDGYVEALNDLLEELKV